MLRQARSVGLKLSLSRQASGNASLSNIAGDAAEGMLVTMPKRYDQDPANQGIVDALKADKIRPGHMSGSPTRRCNLWQLPLSVPAAMSRWRW